MDERINGDYNRRPSSGETPKRPSASGDYRSAPTRPSAPPQREGKFKVTLPDEVSYTPTERPRPQAGTRPTSIQRNSGTQSASRPTRPRPLPQRPIHPGESRSSAAAASRAQRRTTDSNQSKPSPEKEKKAEQKSYKRREKLNKKTAGTPRSRNREKLTPEQAAKRQVERRYNRTKSLLILLSSLIVIAVITTTLCTIALSTIDDLLALNKESGSTVSVFIPENASFDEVLDILSDNGLISQKALCKLFGKFRHYDYSYNREEKKYSTPVKYQTGVYYFESDDGLESMLEEIKASSGSEKETIRLTFPEGWTIAQVFAKIEKYNVCEAEKLYTNLDIIGKQFDFYSDIKSTSGRYLKAEGYIFPDTYDFYIGESASSVLTKLFSNFENKWTKDYTEKAKALGYTKDQIITIASIIQREAKDSTQMKDISSIIYNRLKNSETYPLLEMNSTKDYIASMKSYDVLTDFNYTLYLDSYNTYSAKGLPPGAICNPGIEAIDAALNPNDTNYYFFCHDKDGNIYLAETQREHQANTERIFYETN